MKTKDDQTYQELILAYLRKLIGTPCNQAKWRKLLLGEDSDEAAATYLDYNREQVVKKARCIANAPKIIYDRTEKSDECTWQESCEITSRIASKNIHSRTIPK
jgi:hypothetical protein